MKHIYTLIVVLLISTTAAMSTNSDDGEKKKPFTDDSQIIGRVYFDLGLNILRDAPSVMDISAFQSKSVGLYYMRQFDLGKKMSFNPSLGITMEKFSFKNDVVLGYSSTSTDSLAFLPITTGTVNRSKLATSYFEAPMEFRYYFNGNESNDGFYLAFGGSFGIRIESHSKTKYTELGVKKVEKKRDNFQQTNLRYGVHGRIGYKSVNLFYKHSLTTIFGSNGPVNTNNSSFSTIGISFSGL